MLARLVVAGLRARYKIKKSNFVESIFNCNKSIHVNLSSFSCACLFNDELKHKCVCLLLFYQTGARSGPRGQHGGRCPSAKPDDTCQRRRWDLFAKSLPNTAATVSSHFTLCQSRSYCQMETVHTWYFLFSSLIVQCSSNYNYFNVYYLDQIT